MHRSINFIKVTCLFLIGILSACHPDKKTIIIKGDIKGVNTTKVYLYKTFPVGSTAIDSAKVVNDHFEFKIHTDTLFQPEMGFIGFTDVGNTKNQLGIINPYSPHKDKPDLFVDFYIEPGTTTLSGDLTKNRHAGIKIESGEQNDFNFRHIYLPFIRITKDSTSHRSQLGRLKKLIHDNPNAYQAMFALYSWRFYLKNDEIKSLYTEFNDEVKQAYLGRVVAAFLKQRPDDSSLIPNSLLTTIDEKQAEMIDTTKKLNMVVFWASWCGPCKQEIPVLRKIYAGYQNNNFRMVSVSLDKDKTKWKQMLEIQKMPWQQLDIEAKNLNNLTALYNLGFIPKIYFINNKRKLVGEIDGADPNGEAAFKKIIAANL
ncbi:AhpC/TSA family protein [Mucilaginibacter sp. BJC16-A38]|uniref:TlpA disulfide reductase family protein n=1 Tax=Mucilaginibacter phenanthrenivorans TaxID=1234842 RepID=UPI002157C030|nr:TlpA disulfide reductase family protein [Mucilaginibacter phenanthrenivorans]MCR8559479.1 AhpC/TSA family protein [Mucilaginibacter phenanthrenivorans]